MLCPRDDDTAIHTHYLKWLFVYLIIIIVSVATFNGIIDPFGRYQFIQIAGINTEKTQLAILGIRTIKAVDLKGGNYHTVILGSSRANYGIDPTHAALQSMGNGYNASLNGTNLYELEKVFQFILKHQPQLQVVIFSLDFLLFSSRRATNADFDQSLFSEQHSIVTHLKNSFSLDETFYAVKTILDNRLGKQAAYRSLYTTQGMASPDFPLPHHALFVNTLVKHFFTNEQTYAGFCYSQDRLKRLQRIIQTCRARGIDLKLFISPIHAWQMEAIRVMGLYPTFEQWKWDITLLVAQEGMEQPDKSRYTLWDFSGYNSITTEPLPTDPQQSMRWYWDSSHFKKETGDLVLDKIVGYTVPDRTIPADFGTVLTPTTLENHLAAIRAARTHYHQTHPSDIREIEQLAEKTAVKINTPCPPD